MEWLPGCRAPHGAEGQVVQLPMAAFCSPTFASLPSSLGPLRLWFLLVETQVTLFMPQLKHSLTLWLTHLLSGPLHPEVATPVPVLGCAQGCEEAGSDPQLAESEPVSQHHHHHSELMSVDGFLPVRQF